MPTIIPPGYGEVTTNITSGHTGRICHNVFGVDLTGVPSQAALDLLSTTYGTAYQEVLSTDGSYDGLTLLIGQDGGEPTVMESVAGALPGVLSSPLGSPQVQGLVAKRGAAASRQARGRTFLPDVPESMVDQGGNLDSTYLGNAQDFADEVIAGLLVGTFSGMVILHSTVRTPDPVTSYIAQSRVATLRTRYDRS